LNQLWNFLRGAVLIAVLAVASGCATVAGNGTTRAGTDNDPFEPFNRGVFAVNQVLDRDIIKPVAKGYRAALPEVVRDGIRAFIDNLHEPLVFANDLLQGRGDAAGITIKRFVMNSTIGLAGIFDRATESGLARQSGDFGQTLYSWGFVDGPYLVLPLLGPTNIRDAIGTGVDSYASPIGRIGSDQTGRKITVGVGIVDGIDLRARNIESLESLEASSLDYYAYFRSITRQHRQATLREAKGLPPEDDLADPGADKADDKPAETPPPVSTKPPDR
jgi:phospholipid-binding lipoprotein MlaA